MGLTSSEQTGLTLDMLGSVMQQLATRHIFPSLSFLLNIAVILSDMSQALRLWQAFCLSFGFLTNGIKLEKKTWKNRR